MTLKYCNNKMGPVAYNFLSLVLMVRCCGSVANDMQILDGCNLCEWNILKGLVNIVDINVFLFFLFFCTFKIILHLATKLICHPSQSKFKRFC